MPFILLFFAGLAYLHFGVKKQQTSDPQSKGRKGVGVQPISYQAVQGFAQGDKTSPGYFNRYTEANQAMVQPSQNVHKGISAQGGTKRVLADLLNKIESTFDPQWKMRYMNAYHRISLQKDINDGREPQGDLNVDRTDPHVNDDTGEASGFTRTQITYQHRFTRGRPRAGWGPNATRQLDQEDPGDQTSMQTALNPNGWKSIIYPRADHDRDGVKKPWCGLRVVNLEKDYWAKSGRPYNQVGATQSDMPVNKGWMWSFIIPKRGKHGAYPSGRNLPGRSNRKNDSVATGECS